MMQTESLPTRSDYRLRFVVLALTVLLGAAVSIAIEQPATLTARDILAVVSK